VTGGGRQAARLGEIQIGDSSVALKDINQSAIRCI
jgi:hypothetical protein